MRQFGLGCSSSDHFSMTHAILCKIPERTSAIPGPFPCSISVLNKATPPAIGARHWNLFCLTMSGMEFGVIPTGVCHKNQSHWSTRGVSESMNVWEKFLLSCTRDTALLLALRQVFLGLWWGNERDQSSPFIPIWLVPWFPHEAPDLAFRKGLGFIITLEWFFCGRNTGVF